ncbi:MAG: glycosyltransferase family 4 protein [Pyrinomonadaceae bacterium]
MTRESLDIVLYTEGLPFTGDTLDRQALGGSETAFIYVARELARLGHKVTAYCYCTDEGLYDGVTYKDASRIGELAQRECDLFICSRFFLVFSNPIRARARFLWLHDIPMESLNEHLTFLAPKIDLIYGLSDYHCRHVGQTLPELRPKIRKLMNGLDTSPVEEALAASKGKRHKIMFASRPERGLWEALDAYERLQDPDLELLICTYSYPQGDDIKALEERCRRRVRRLAERGFRVSTGSFTKSDLYRHMAESKAVIYPAQVPEIFCICAIEAQACGTVFLTVDDFALKETVGYERVPCGDAEAFHGRLKAILADETLRRTLEAKGREHVKPYTWGNVARLIAQDTERQLQMSAVARLARRTGYSRLGHQTPLYSARLADALAALAQPPADVGG